MPLVDRRLTSRRGIARYLRALWRKRPPRRDAPQFEPIGPRKPAPLSGGAAAPLDEER